MATQPMLVVVVVLTWSRARAAWWESNSRPMTTFSRRWVPGTKRLCAS